MIVALRQLNDPDLITFVDEYTKARGAKEATAKAMRSPVRSLCRMLSRRVRVAELSLTVIEDWAAWKRQQGMSETTIRAQKDFLFALWRLASEMGLAETAPPAWMPHQQYSAIGVTREELLSRVEAAPKLSHEDIRLCMAFFNARGVKRPAVADQLEISPSYLNAVAYKSKRVTTQFRDRLLGLLRDESRIPPVRRKARRSKLQRLPERLIRLPYEEFANLAMPVPPRHARHCRGRRGASTGRNS